MVRSPLSSGFMGERWLLEGGRESEISIDRRGDLALSNRGFFWQNLSTDESRRRRTQDLPPAQFDDGGEPSLRVSGGADHFQGDASGGFGGSEALV